MKALIFKWLHKFGSALLFEFLEYVITLLKERADNNVDEAHVEQVQALRTDFTVKQKASTKARYRR